MYVCFTTRESLHGSQRIRGWVVPRASFRVVVNREMSASALNRDLISRLCSHGVWDPELCWRDSGQRCLFPAAISNPILISKLESYTSLVISTAGQFPDCGRMGACDIMCPCITIRTFRRNSLRPSSQSKSLYILLKMIYILCMTARVCLKEVAMKFCSKGKCR
jgi:hypothetical protein